MFTLTKRFNKTVVTFELVYEDEKGYYDSRYVVESYPKKLTEKQLLKRKDEVKEHDTLLVRISDIKYVKAVANIPYDVAKPFVHEVE